MRESLPIKAENSDLEIVEFLSVTRLFVHKFWKRAGSPRQEGFTGRPKKKEAF